MDEAGLEFYFPMLHCRNAHDLCASDIQHYHRLLHSHTSRSHCLEAPNALQKEEWNIRHFHDRILVSVSYIHTGFHIDAYWRYRACTTSILGLYY